MPIFARDFNNLLADSLAELTDSTSLTRTSPGSKIRTILSTVNRRLSEGYQDFDINFARAFLSGADGKWLDLIGELLGIPRLGVSVAQTTDTAQIVKFYVDSGNFGDINNGSDINLPANTILSTLDNQQGTLYKILQAATLVSSQSELFISVVAITPGESSNIGANSLTFHSFTNYTDSANKTLKVNNIANIFNGSDVESDTNYKFRISRSALSSEAANQTSIILAALSVPGVANVILQNRAEGIGTYRIIIKSITPSVSTNLIDNVNAALSRVTAEGVRGLVSRPLETGMTFLLTLTYKNGIGDDEKDAIDVQVRNSITDYVDNLDIGEPFILNQLVDRVLSVSSSIKDIGEPNKPIDDMFVYRETRLNDNKIRQELLANYTPQGNERIIIEPSISTPITIIRAN